MTTQPHCPYCSQPATLAGGEEIYPRRPDLSDLKFWRCKPCEAYVGCHKAGSYSFVKGVKVTSDGTLPLGRLANAKLREAKKQAHAAFDPLWSHEAHKGAARRLAYSWLSTELSVAFQDCHIGNFDEQQCQQVVDACKERGQGQLTHKWPSKQQKQGN